MGIGVMTKHIGGKRFLLLNILGKNIFPPICLVHLLGVLQLRVLELGRARWGGSELSAWSLSFPSFEPNP